MEEALGKRIVRTRSNVPKNTSRTVVVISDSEDNEIVFLGPVLDNDDNIEALESNPQAIDPNSLDIRGNNVGDKDGIECLDTVIHDSIEALESDTHVSDPDFLDKHGDNVDLELSQHNNPRNTNIQVSTSNTPSDVIDSTFDLYDEEEEQRNHANDLVQYMKASIDEDMSDEEHSETEDDPLEKMWSIFYGPILPVESKTPKQCLKSGKSGYQQPVKSKDPSSHKLVPRVLPRQTKHDRKKRQLAALGPNNNIMANFLAQKQPVNKTSANKTSDSDMMIDPVLNNASSSNPAVSNEATQRLNDIQAHYLSTPKPCQAKSQDDAAQSKADKAKAQWDELHLAVVAAKAVLKEKEKKTRTLYSLNQWLITSTNSTPSIIN
jgi:hypothetical protein